jgi:acetyl esterase/lipase
VKLPVKFRSWRVALPALLLVGCAAAKPPVAPAAVPLNLYIWPDADVAVAKSGEPKEQDFGSSDEPMVRNVTQASVDVYLPDPATAKGGAMLVCPGGAFYFLTMQNEGIKIAHWLNARGTAAFVLHYRLRPTPRWAPAFYLKMLFVLPSLLSGKSTKSIEPDALPAVADGEQAMRYIRSHSADWHLDPQRIGVTGFSAGGMVAVGTALTRDAQARPDFAAALYSGPLEVKQVPADAPPLFAAAAADDPLTAIGTQPIAAAWTAGSAPVELHIYKTGGHGFKPGSDSDRWKNDFGAWLAARGL